jgi:ribose transport system substrate-binding protein
VRIAVVVKAVTGNYWRTVGAGVDQAMQDDPTITATYLGPGEETDIEGQIRIIEAQISAGVDALAVAPAHLDQIPILQRAIDAGIPVVLIDTDIPDFAAKSAFVGTDNLEGGRLAGDYVVSRLQPGDEVAIIRGAAGDPVHTQRTQGAQEVLEAVGITVVDVQPANSDRAKAEQVAASLLTAHPNLKAIFATNDEMALGAVAASQAAGRRLVIVGFDATQDAVQAIRDGVLDASVAQFPSKIGELGVLTAAKVARDQAVDAVVDTGVQLVTQDNIANWPN